MVYGIQLRVTLKYDHLTYKTNIDHECIWGSEHTQCL